MLLLSLKNGQKKQIKQNTNFMLENAQPKNNQETLNANEVKSDFLISLTVTITFAIIPGIIHNLDLEPKISIVLMIVMGILAISIIYYVFKYPNSQIVKRLTFNVEINDRRAKSLFIFLIIFVVTASSYIFWRNHIFDTKAETSINSFLSTKSNNSNLSSEFSKLLPYLDSADVNKVILNNCIKFILEEGHEYIKEEFNLKEEDLKISIFKKIQYQGECFFYEQNWTGSEVDKCFTCSYNSLIGCASKKEDIFVLFKPSFKDKELCAWSVNKNPKAMWNHSTKELVFNDETECQFNILTGDYHREGMLCFYSNYKNGKSELGICLDFNNAPNNIYSEEKVKSTILDIVQKIMIIPDEFYAENDYKNLRDRVKKNCHEQNTKK